MGVLIAIMLALIMLALNPTLRVQTYKVKSEKMTGAVRIVLVTDLHSCRYGDNQADLIREIAEQNPDIVLLGGDIFDDILPNDRAEQLLKGIADKYPCYYVTGNHEYWSGNIDGILDLVRSYDVTVLNGTYDTIEVNGQKINVCGVSDPDVVSYTETAVGTKEQLKMLKDVQENGEYTILLAHRPEEIERYSEYGFDLVLSGHTHGGQWRLPGIVNGLFAPNQGWFPRYAGGKYLVNGTWLIVSRGLARESTRIPRIFNRPELVVVDLESAG
ncbi:metallophosphoesterase [Bacillota bacterium Meth-B3]